MSLNQLGLLKAYGLHMKSTLSGRNGDKKKKTVIVSLKSFIDKGFLNSLKRVLSN